MAESVKRRGRPRGSKNKTPAKQRFTTNPPPTGIAAEIEEIIEEKGRLMAEGNGQDGGEYAVEDPVVDDDPGEAAYRARLAQKETVAPIPPARPTFPNLFIHTVENGYIIRPAYPQGDRLASTDVRTWIVPTREALAALIVELMAVPRLEQDAPQKLPQPGVFYSPPIIMETSAS
jgi:hypothetical protein